MSHRLSILFLMLSSCAVLIAKEGTVTDDLNMRLGPGVNHPVIGVLPPGASVSIVGTSGQWYQINPKAVVEGYVITKSLKGSRVLIATEFRTEASENAASIACAAASESRVSALSEAEISSCRLSEPDSPASRAKTSEANAA